MARFDCTSAEQARAILHAWDHCCGWCDDRCPLKTPEGWRCGYLAERAEAYLKRHGTDDAKTSAPSA